MRRFYEEPEAKLLELCGEDIMTTSPGLGVSDETGSTGGSFDFNDWLNKLTVGGEGGDGSIADVNDQLGDAT